MTHQKLKLIFKKWEMGFTTEMVVKSQHVNKHSGFKRYKCHYFECDQSFDDFSNLKRHINWVELGQHQTKCIQIVFTPNKMYWNLFHTKQNVFKFGSHQTKCIEMWFDLKERTLECDFEDCDKSLSTKPQFFDHKKRHAIEVNVIKVLLRQKSEKHIRIMFTITISYLIAIKVWDQIIHKSFTCGETQHKR